MCPLESTDCIKTTNVKCRSYTSNFTLNYLCCGINILAQIPDTVIVKCEVYLLFSYLIYLPTLYLVLN